MHTLTAETTADRDGVDLGDLDAGEQDLDSQGTVNYVKHEGSRPMNITWRLNRPIPAKFLKKTNKLVVG